LKVEQARFLGCVLERLTKRLRMIYRIAKGCVHTSD
jgi:hypothetical protein